MRVTDENDPRPMSGAPSKQVPTFDELLKSATKPRNKRKSGAATAFSPHPVNAVRSPSSFTGGMLISPPPEDELAASMKTPSSRIQLDEPGSGSSSGSASGSVSRKRGRSDLGHEASTTNSPNPKARKQQRINSNTVQYSPPRIEFTPPRTIVIHDQPSHTRTRALKNDNSRQSTPKRAGTPKRSGTPKLNLDHLRSPLITRNAVIPPSSPTDDPILLVGDVKPDWAAHARALEPRPKLEEDDAVVPPTPARVPAKASALDRPASPDDPFTHMGGVDRSSEEAMGDISPPSAGSPPPPVVPAPAPLGRAWSPVAVTNDAQPDSDSDGPYQEIEYPVPIAQDPPTARTKARMERFGRPKSPYPLDRSTIIEQDEEDESEDEQGLILPQELTRRRDGSPVSRGSRQVTPLETSRGASPINFAPSSSLSPVDHAAVAAFEASRAGLPAEPVVQSESTPVLQRARPPAARVVRKAQRVPVAPTAEPPRPPTPPALIAEGDMGDDVDHSRGQSSISDSRGEISRELLAEDASFSRNSWNGDNSFNGRDDSFESAGDRSMGSWVGDHSMSSNVSRGRRRYRDESSDASEDDMTGPGVIQISSKDPLAAARAAAILKRHHKYIQEGLLSKPPRSSRSRSRSQSVGRPASPAFSVVSNQDLLRLAEAEIQLGASGRKTPPRMRKSKRDREEEAAYQPDTSQWTKSDWKMLDRSFTEVRLELAGNDEAGSMADVNVVEPGDVVQRFLDIAFGQELEEREEELVGDWSREKLARRVIALRSKQRGNPAPTPRIGQSFRRTPSIRAPSETPSMMIPDFTPSMPGPRGRIYPDLHKLLGGGSQPLTFATRPDFGKPLPLKRELSGSSGDSGNSLDKEMRRAAKEAVPATRSPTATPNGTRRRGTVDAPRKVPARMEDVPTELVSLSPKSKSTPVEAPATPTRAPAPPVEPPSTAKRVIGYLGSWLGVSKPLAQQRQVGSAVSQRPGPHLPPPPPARSRNVATPPRRVAPREPAPAVSLHRPPPAIHEPSPERQHPRDAVELQHAEQLRWEAEQLLHPRDTVDLHHAEPNVFAPQPILHPRDAVALHHVSPPPPAQPSRTVVPRPRTSSGSSVKDLIKGFEEAQAQAPARNADLELAKLKMKRTKSMQGIGQVAAAQPQGRSASANLGGSREWRP